MRKVFKVIVHYTYTTGLLNKFTRENVKISHSDVRLYFLEGIDDRAVREYAIQKLNDYLITIMDNAELVSHYCEITLVCNLNN